MLGSSALDFGIGMVFVYLMLSLTATSLQEGLATLVRRRAHSLSEGIKNLVRDQALAEAIYAHPLIRSLYQGSRRPSYVPSKLFALALLDALTPPGEGTDHQRLRQALTNGSDPVHGALRALLKDADDDASKFQENIEVWFNHVMERVSGVYKRWTQCALLGIAACLTIALNADSLVIGRAVWQDPTLRASLVAEAQKVQAQSAPSVIAPAIADEDTPPPPPAEPPESLQTVLDDSGKYVQRLRDVQLPLGWSRCLPGAAAGQCLESRVMEQFPGSILSAEGRGRWLSAVENHWLGWFITVLAISLGAPFWFDLLNKFMAVRGAGKAPEERPKSPKEEQRAMGPGETPKESRDTDKK